MFTTFGPEHQLAPLVPAPLTLSRKGSNASIASIASLLSFRGEDDEIVTVDGLPHAPRRLAARKYKSDDFARHVLDTVINLRVPSWYNNSQIVPEGIKIQKVSGSLTNAVFFVSYPTIPYIRTLLLRIYGASSGNLISRPHELQTLHILSSQYHIGPKVYGTFENGRFEEYFNSAALTAADLRDSQISRWIGARMAEFHQVDVHEVEGSAVHEDGVKKNVQSWVALAQGVLALPAVKASVRANLNLEGIPAEWDKYLKWLKAFESNEGGSRRVFCHNDAQYGNILRLASLEEGVPEHRQIIVVDFEYASQNPAAFDVANHFHEWTANYHGAAPHILDFSRYPTAEERNNFYAAYVSHSNPSLSEDERTKMMAALDSQVRAWSPASHLMWGLWGIVQAREELEANESEPEFDYLGYAQCRLDGFRREIQALMV